MKGLAEVIRSLQVHKLIADELIFNPSLVAIMFLYPYLK